MSHLSARLTQRPSAAASPRCRTSTSCSALRSTRRASGHPYRSSEADLRRSRRTGRGSSSALRWQTVAAVQQEQLPPGESRQAGGGLLDRFFSLITGFPFPIGPNFVRQTIRYEVERDRLWTFEQPQNLAFTNVHTTIRMTVIRLRGGGLFVYSPIAPTAECVQLLRELGRVEYIALTTHAYEHKLFVAPFSRKFPYAKVYVAPHQWSFPLNLPVQLFGIFPAGLLEEGGQYPWGDELDLRIFSANLAQVAQIAPIHVRVGPGIYSSGCYGAGATGDVGSLTEVAFYHRPTRTLLFTDAVILVPPEPPAVVQRRDLLLAGGNPWYTALLYGTGDETKKTIKMAQRRATTLGGRRTRDDEAGRILLGWQRMCLLVLCLKPENLLDPNDSFRSFAGRLTISPVVERLVFSKVPDVVAAWIEDICSSWDFNRIIPAHLAAPISASPKDLRETFSFAFQNSDVPARSGWFGLKVPAPKPKRTAFPAEDVTFLRSLSQGLNRIGLILPDRA